MDQGSGGDPSPPGACLTFPLGTVASSASASMDLACPWHFSGDRMASVLHQLSASVPKQEEPSDVWTLGTQVRRNRLCPLSDHLFDVGPEERALLHLSKALPITW
jgi:hypothetical protein